MSITSEQSKQPLVTSVFLDDHSSYSALSQTLLELSHCDSIYDGDVATFTDTIAYAIVKNLGTTSCQVWFYTDNRSQLEPAAYYGTMASKQPNGAINIANHGDYFYKLAQRDWLIINTGKQTGKQRQLDEPHVNHGAEATTFPPYLWDQAQSITALVEIPIYHQQQIIGILCCTQHHSPRVWQAAETTFMATAACLIALTVSHRKNQQQAKTLCRQKRQLTLETIERQQAEIAWQESQCFIQGILDASTNILYVNNFATGTNYYVNSYMEKILGYSPKTIQTLGAQFLEQITHPDDIPAIHQARQKLAQSNSGDIIENEYRLHHKQGGWHWMLCRETVFQWGQDGTPLQLLGTATDITMRKQAEAALEQKNQALTALVMVDGLTQVANRRAFDECLARAWADRTNAPLSLILCDIDFFKRYNDNYGHQQGDTCIKRVAQTLKKAVKRRPDLVARYGGEEFAIILPNTTTEGAKHVAQNIQTAIQSLEIEHLYSAVSNYITISLGIATTAVRLESSPDNLIAAADQGLYRAKSNGRDQFAIGYIDSDIPQL